jgi:hypothetical protein
MERLPIAGKTSYIYIYIYIYTPRCVSVVELLICQTTSIRQQIRVLYWNREVMCMCVVFRFEFLLLCIVLNSQQTNSNPPKHALTRPCPPYLTTQDTTPEENV